MPTLGAYIIAHNEADLLEGCIQRILPFVDELLLVNHGSTDKTEAIMDRIEEENPRKVVVMHTAYELPIDMGKLRTTCYIKMKADWVLNVDADEYYPASAMATIKSAIDQAKPDGPISFRVHYHNLAWRPGYRQANFTHTPDRLYRRDVVDFVGGLLPNDMHNVKKEFYTHNPVLEYDNAEDKSFEHPRQPILDAWYYHLARTRGYHFELSKWRRYQKNLHPEVSDDENERIARVNQWVTGLYTIEPMDGNAPHPPAPVAIPLRTIPQPKVSVIIPCYNYGQYVDEAIASVLAQTYPIHEVIVVDDASSDDSYNRIIEWTLKDKRVKILKHMVNKGVATARNGGIAMSTGDYFLCLDADDRLTPDAIAKLVGAMGETIQVAYPNLRFFGDQEGTWDAPEPSREAMRAYQIVPSTCALVDRRCFEIGGGFDPNFIYEDTAFWCNLLIEHGFNFCHVNAYLLEYRKHPGGRCEENDKQQAKGFEQLRVAFGFNRKPDIV